MSDETTAPTPWVFNQRRGVIFDATGRTLVIGNVAGIDDEMRLMASAPDLARALREDMDDCERELSGDARRAGYVCHCQKCDRNRALLAALPVLPEEK